MFNNHTHDHYSNTSLGFPDVLCKTEDLIQRAYDIGLTGITITNHESLSGVVSALNYYNSMLKERPFTLAIGNEIYLQAKEEFENNRDNNGDTPYYHFILTALDTEGYHQLCELSTRAWERGFKRNIWRRVTLYEDLEEIIKPNQGHIIASSACLGSRIDKLLLENKIRQVFDEIRRLVDIFGEGNFYLECQPAKAEDTEQSKVNRMLKGLMGNGMTTDFTLPLIPSTDAHFLCKEDRKAHSVYLGSGDGENERDEFYTTAYLMDDNELREYLRIDFSDEQIDQMYAWSNELSQRIKGYDIFHNPIIPQIPVDKIPEFEITHAFKSFYDQYEAFGYYANQTDIHERYFFYQLEQGLLKHIVNNPKKRDNINQYIERVNIELTELKKISEALGTSMVCYYSTMSKICELMWECGSIVGAGRGSSVAFVINYLLDITSVDCVPLGDIMPHWRHMSIERGAEVSDIDTDSEPSKKYIIINKMKEFFGEDKVLNVATFSKISSKTAIEKACRGLGISADEANYMKSLIPVNRGKTATLSECYYGDKEKDIKPVYELIKEVRNYPELEAISLKLEGVLANRSIHAAGLCVCNEPYVKYLSAMRAPDGTLETSLNLWDAETVSLVKFDLLTVSALQKIHKAMDVMLEKGVIEWQGSLKATYDKYLHPDVIDYTTPEMWEQLPQMYSVFQWDTPISTKTLSAIKPKSIMDLTAGNSLLRLMPDGVEETPVDRYIRYKEHPEQWEEEATAYGLNEDEKQVIREICGSSYYMAESQESIMRIAMDSRVAGYTLKESNKLRKSIAKKSEKLQAEAKDQFFEWGEKQGTREVFLKYVWDVLFAASRGYSFSSIHSYAYSIIALQELNLYYHYGSIYWNIGCLSTEAIGDDEGSGGGTDYGAISKAIYKMKGYGITVSPPSINNSGIDFECDEKSGEIYFGLGGISGINNDIAQQILTHRPYSSFHDFYIKNSYPGSLITESKFITLIKAGCFDQFSTRTKAMKQYILYSQPIKSSLTAANLQEAQRIGCKFPRALIAPMNFRKYVCSKQFLYSVHPNFKSKKIYWLDDKALRYFNANCRNQLTDGVDYWEEEDRVVVVDKSLEKLLKASTDGLKEYMNTAEFVDEFNKKSMKKRFDEMCPNQDENHWSFESTSYYHNGHHELENLDFERYNIDKFADLPEEPQFIEKTWGSRSWRQYSLGCITGVILSRNDNNHLVTILTPENNVVSCKLHAGLYAKYKAQISEVDGTVIEKSWLARGNLIILSGYRRGESDWVVKRYSSSVYNHSIQKILRVNADGSAEIQSERYGSEAED